MNKQPKKVETVEDHEEEQRKEEAKIKKEEETRRKKEDYKELSERQKKQKEAAEEVAIKLGKKKGEWYTNPYYIVFGVLGFMFFYVVIILIVNKAPPLNKTPVIDEKKIQEHNSSFQWKQGPNKFFEGATLADAKKIINTSFASHSNLAKCPVDETYIPPENFDARIQWPTCMSPVGDQTKKCEASYSFAISQAFSERLCINSKDQKLVPLSSQELLSCDKESKGCQGGFLNVALDYVRLHGLVDETCMPFTGKTGECTMCEKPQKEKFESFCVVFGENDIKKEIAQHGPVIATTQVYINILTYKEGVYIKGDDVPKFSGQTAVKIIGWGTQSGDEDEPNKGNKYWLIQKSWGEDWGEQGIAKVLMGQEFLFENYAYAIKVRGEIPVKPKEIIREAEIPDMPDVNLDEEKKE